MKWKSRVIYQVLTDRFASSRGRLSGLTKTGPAFRWMQFAGGDHEGLRRRLDYLEDLGVSALWVSPIVLNSWLEPDGGPRSKRVDGYHGYWARDFSRLQPDFGDTAALQRLLDDCRERDLAPVLDVVLNHTSPVYAHHCGDLYHEGRLLASYYDDRKGYFHHLGELDPTLSYDPYLWENCNVWNLADLAQEHPEVDALLKTVYLRWLKMGFQGVRLDTASHVPAAWLGEWVEATRQEIPELFAFAEWWGAGADDVVSLTAAREMRMHLTDFRLAQLWRGWLCGRRQACELVEYAALEQAYVEPDLRVNFLDNHDMPRLMNLLLDEGFNIEQAEARLEAGLALLLFWRGVPCLYYGTETALFTRRRRPGALWGDDPYNREPMRFPSSPTRGMELVRLMTGLRREAGFIDEDLRVHSSAPGELHLERGDFALRVRLKRGTTTLELGRGGSVLWSLGA